jgi:predicted nicotinamide N-methyase
LASYLSKNMDIVSSKRVLELGAGTALPGLLAVKLGATSVLLTDRSDMDLKNARDSIALNRLGDKAVTTVVFSQAAHDETFLNWL